MADVPQVTIVDGIPTAGTGTVETLSTTNTVIGAVNETAPASDTASSGLNGRLQRIAQNISSLISSVAGVAHDVDASAVDPTLTGLYAHLTQPTPVSASTDAVRAFGDADGAAVVRTNTNLESIVSGTTSNTDGTATTVIAASGDAAIKHYLTELELSNTSTDGVVVEIKSGTTVRRSLYIPALSLYTKTFNPPLPPNAANELWGFDAAAATTTLYCNMIGFKSKV